MLTFLCKFQFIVQILPSLWHKSSGKSSPWFLPLEICPGCALFLPGKFSPDCTVQNMPSLSLFQFCFSSPLEICPSCAPSIPGKSSPDCTIGKHARIGTFSVPFFYREKYRGLFSVANHRGLFFRLFFRGKLSGTYFWTWFPRQIIGDLGFSCFTVQILSWLHRRPTCPFWVSLIFAKMPKKHKYQNYLYIYCSKI